MALEVALEPVGPEGAVGSLPVLPARDPRGPDPRRVSSHVVVMKPHPRLFPHVLQAAERLADRVSGLRAPVLGEQVITKMAPPRSARLRALVPLCRTVESSIETVSCARA